jgi:hypothetical protein
MRLRELRSEAKVVLRPLFIADPNRQPSACDALTYNSFVHSFSSLALDCTCRNRINCPIPSAGHGQSASASLVEIKRT